MEPGLKNQPQLLNNEEVILISPGFYKENLLSGWKPGHLYLTNFRLFLWQQTRNLFQISLESITGIDIQQRDFILRSKDTLCLSYHRPGSKESSCIWIMVKDMETWKKKVFEGSLLQIKQEAIERIAEELDPESKAIVYYLWQNRFATIDELASLCNASNHMDILLRIRDVINPLAEKTVGSPLLVFEKSKVDPETGRKILFSWWLIGRERGKERRETLLDLFDEGDHIRITMELLALSEEYIRLRVNQDKLIISTDSSEKEHQEEILLPSSVNSTKISKRYKNGILEVKLQKN